MRLILIAALLCYLSFFSFGQATSLKPSKSPKLVVGLVVDQMRWDYLYRYQDRYAEGGFKRLLSQGFSCDNTFIPYTPTYTAAGHASIYTGSVPAINGIMGNNWFSRELGRNVYCTDDSTVKTVGSSSGAGQMSPKNLWTTTITDELRIATNFRSKVIAFALKDRGSILPGGHSANASYWFDDALGGWITSNFYMEDLPAWVKKLNATGYPQQAMKKDWNTLYPIDSYLQSTADSQGYEGSFGGSKNIFPYQLSAMKNGNASFRTTPFGNTYTLDAGRAAIEAENLGGRGVTDFLALSLSSPDYIGHTFGPNSIEVEDTYLRLDRDIASFLLYLDKKIGKGNYLLFLSADHGAAHSPAFMKQNRLPAGVMSESALRKELSNAVKGSFGIDNAILQVINYQVYLNHESILNAGADFDKVSQFVIKHLLKRDEITNAFRLDDPSYPVPAKVSLMFRNGYNQKLSGDIQYFYKPGWFDGGQRGTTHGVWNPHDAHIPLVWFGWNVKPGKTSRETYMTDIAPTLAAMLKIQMPNGAIGDVIEEVSK